MRILAFIILLCLCHESIRIQQPVGTTGIKVDEIKDRKLVDLWLSEQFPPDKLELTLGRWPAQEKVMFFNAEAVTGEERNNVIQNRTGSWKVDVETKELSRVSIS